MISPQRTQRTQRKANHECYQNVVVEDLLIIELKTVKTSAPEHQAQVIGYLKSFRLEDGLLINFGSHKFETRKFAWSDQLQKPKMGLGSVFISAFLAFFAV